MDKQDCGNVHSDMFFSDLKKPAIEPQTEALKCVLLAERSLSEKATCCMTPTTGECFGKGKMTEQTISGGLGVQWNGGLILPIEGEEIFFHFIESSLISFINIF